jgi:acid phosphatase class B
MYSSQTTTTKSDANPEQNLLTIFNNKRITRYYQDIAGNLIPVEYKLVEIKKKKKKRNKKMWFPKDNKCLIHDSDSDIDITEDIIELHAFN